MQIFPNGVRKDNVLLAPLGLLNPMSFGRAMGRSMNEMFGNPAPQTTSQAGPNTDYSQFLVTPPQDAPPPPPPMLPEPVQGPVDGQPGLSATPEAIDTTDWTQYLVDDPFGLQQMAPPMPPQVPPPQQLQQSVPFIPPQAPPTQMDNAVYNYAAHSQQQAPQDAQAAAEAYAQSLINAPNLAPPDAYHQQSFDQMQQQQMPQVAPQQQLPMYAPMMPQQPAPFAPSPNVQDPNQALQTATPGMMSSPMAQNAQQFQLNPESQATYNLMQRLAQSRLQGAIDGSGAGPNAQVMDEMQQIQRRMQRNNMMSSIAGFFSPGQGMMTAGMARQGRGGVGMSIQQRMMDRNAQEAKMYAALSKQMGGQPEDLAKMASYLNAVRGYDPSSPENQRKATYSETAVQNANTRQFQAQDTSQYRQSKLGIDMYNAQSRNDLGYMKAATDASRASSYSQYLKDQTQYHNKMIDQREKERIDKMSTAVASLEERAEYHRRMGDVATYNALMGTAHDIAIEEGRRVNQILKAGDPNLGYPQEIQNMVGVPQPPQEQQQSGPSAGWFADFMRQFAPQQQAQTAQPLPQAPQVNPQVQALRNQASGIFGGQPAQPKYDLNALLAERVRRQKAKK